MPRSLTPAQRKARGQALDYDEYPTKQSSKSSAKKTASKPRTGGTFMAGPAKKTSTVKGGKSAAPALAAKVASKKRPAKKGVVVHGGTTKSPVVVTAKKSSTPRKVTSTPAQSFVITLVSDVKSPGRNSTVLIPAGKYAVKEMDLDNGGTVTVTYNRKRVTFKPRKSDSLVAKGSRTKFDGTGTKTTASKSPAPAKKTASKKTTTRRPRMTDFQVGDVVAIDPYADGESDFYGKITMMDTVGKRIKVNRQWWVIADMDSVILMPED